MTTTESVNVFHGLAISHRIWVQWAAFGVHQNTPNGVAPCQKPKKEVV